MVDIISYVVFLLFWAQFQVLSGKGTFFSLLLTMISFLGLCGCIIFFRPPSLCKIFFCMDGVVLNPHGEEAQEKPPGL